MASNLNYKQVVNVTRRTWDVEAYEKKAKAREEAAQQDGGHQRKKAGGEAAVYQPDADDEEKEEFKPAMAGAAGPEGSKRAFLKARREKVDIDSKVGTNEMVSLEAASTSSTSAVTGDVQKSDAVVKTGVGWHCKVCDCFLKDSHTYLDHINGRKHQRNLGYSMRVERSTKDQLMNRLSRLAEEKQQQEAKKNSLLDDPAETNYDDVVKEKDEALKRRKEERKRRRKERKKRLAEENASESQQGPAQEKDGDNEEKTGDGDNDGEQEVEDGGLDPAMAAMMGFSGFGGSNKHG